MTALKLSAFGGQLPAWDSRLLPEGQADFALNCYLFSGSLIGWRQPKLLRELLNTSAKFVYRIPNRETNDTSITATDSKWLEFTDPDTNVMRTPVVQDQWQRYYAACPSDVPRYNTYDRIMEDKHWWMLGVPASGCTPGVTITGGGDSTQLGFITAGTSDLYRPGHQLTLVKIVPDGTMLIQSVTFKPVGADESVSFRGIVYSDLNGKPYELIGTGDSVAVDPVVVEQTSTFLNGVSVYPDTTYWIGVHTDGAFSASVVDDTNRGAYYTATYSNDPPDFLNQDSVTILPSCQIWADLLGASVYTARAYVYTWVTAYGEEGPPSLPSVVNGWSNGTWRVELFQPTINNMGADYPVLDEDGHPVLDEGGNPVMKHADRYITHTRIYRSISNQAGMSTYFFVAEIPVEQGVYEDQRPDVDVALELQLVSLYWFGPPEDMKGIEPFPNGVAVGFRSNEIWFSEAYRPHAWPPGYVLTTEFPVVGIGVCGQAIVVCTQGSPYLINGINPSTMALTKINLTEPCLHRGGIVATDTTVLYPSQNGLIQVSQSGQGGNITEGWISRERWQELAPQKLTRAVKHATSYFCFGTDVSDEPIRYGFTIELSQQEQTSFTIWPQAGGHRIGFGQLSSPNEFDIDNVELDAWTGVCLLVQNGGIYYYDFTDLNPTIVPYKWRSKSYQQQSRKNFAAIRAWFTVPGTTPEQVERNVSDPQLELGDNQYGIIRVYADGNLFTTRELRRSGELLRIYSKSTYEQWQFEIEGRVNLSNLQVATSVKELGLV
jgi:hypothetical protein